MAMFLASISACTGTADEHPNDASVAADTGVDAAAIRDAAAQQDARDPSDAHSDADAQSDAAALAQAWDFDPIDPPLHYLGSVDNGAACTHDYTTYGFRPRLPSGTRAPLFLYFAGTSFSTTDQSARGDSLAGRAVSQAMAQRGFVALSVDYDNTPLALISDHQRQLRCLFDPARADSLIARACARDDVDCTGGIATWGHSLGGYVAVMAYSYDPRARAAWATGYGGNAPRTLPETHLRVVNGENDSNNGSRAVLNTACTFPADECASSDTCLRPDGSGWMIVRAAMLQNPGSTADHCWFDRASCSATSYILDPAWRDPASKAPFALAANADWLARAARTPL